MRHPARSTRTSTPLPVPTLFRSAFAPRARQGLLLTAMEGFSRDEAAAILEADEEEIAGLLASAIAEIDRQTATHVLIIEDEPIIAMDLEGIVQGLGHKVAAIADTRSSAVAAARSQIGRAHV